MLNSEKDRNGERGQVLVIGLFVAVGLALISLTVANVGIMVSEKIHLQDTVDAAAYSAAVTQARYLNLTAHINRAIVANYNSMAFNTGLWATVDALDHGLAVAVAFLYQLSVVLAALLITAGFSGPVDSIAAGLDEVHSLLHTFNHELNETFAQDEDGKWNGVIERYNVDVLTMVQGFLYAAAQSARHDVVRTVAEEMDPEIRVDTVLEMGAETSNYDELARAVDWVVRDPSAREDVDDDDLGGLASAFNRSFDRMMGSSADEDNPIHLAAVTEASLDSFAAGADRSGDPDNLRNFSARNLFRGFDSILEGILDTACELATFSFGTCNSDLDFDLGNFVRRGYENDGDDDERIVPAIARQRMREVNQFGVMLRARGVSDPIVGVLSRIIGNQGHTSSDQWGDVGNCANAAWSFEEGFDADRAGESMEQGCIPGVPIPLGGLNSMNMLQSLLMLPSGAVMIPPLVVDDHWDGAFEDIEPVDSWRLPIYGGGPGLVTTVEYQAAIAGDDFETEDGVPRYDWLVDIDNVGFPNFHYPTEGAQVRAANTSAGSGVLSGPSVAVVGVKDANRVNGLRGLGIGNSYSISALARAQVYYLRSGKRPGERPSLFNPHWVARLAPIDSDDTPRLLRDGLPYVAGLGIPIRPTH